HLDIADTPASRFLGAVRRAHWEDEREAPRPGHPAPHLLEDHGTYRTEPLPCHGPFKHPAEGFRDEQWDALDEQRRASAYADQFARAAAEEQVKWEAEMLAIAR